MQTSVPLPGFGGNASLWIGVAAVAAAGAAGGVWLYIRGRKTPEEKERHRRLEVDRSGRMTEAFVNDATDSLLYYSYSVRGVTYSATQDVTALRRLLPADPAALMGHCAVKYAPKNPANSILLCENWSGLRMREAGSRKTDGQEGTDET